MATQSSLRALYRSLLRELPSAATHPASHVATRTAHQKLSAPSSIQRAIRSYIVSDANTTNTPTTNAANTTTPTMDLADQALRYAQAQRMYCTLIERYNPGMGMSEEERVRLSARRIGMNLPKEYAEGDADVEAEVEEKVLEGVLGDGKEVK